MNKLIIVIVVFLGSLSILPFNTSLFSKDQDTLKILTPEEKYKNETVLINQILNRYHYRKTPVNDSLSSVIFDNFITSMDYNKSYFIKDDIESFEKYRYQMDDAIKNGNLAVPFEIFNQFQSRFSERLEYVDSVLEQGFDYTKNESFMFDREDESWTDSEEELDELWRKILKNQALSLKLSGKDDEGTKEVLEKRYKRYRTVLSQYKPEDVYQLFMNSYTETYDPHTNYFNPITAENFNIDMSRSLEGIGARLTKDGDYTIVADIIPGGPAFTSNQLHKDDRIIGVGQEDDGEMVDVVGWRNDDVVQLIRGKKGTKVRLQVLKAEDGITGKPVEVVLIRDKINIEDQRASSKIIPVENDGKMFRLGIITIPEFYKDFEAAFSGDENYNSTTRDVKNLISELENEGIDGLMIDLRRNGGGALDEAVELTGLFIEDGPVVQVKDMEGKTVSEDDQDANIYYSGPLAVLINRFSASASEIFSGAIQDYKRGVVIGEQSFGKGSVQNIIPLDRYVRSEQGKLGNLKMTFAKYYRVTGSSTQNLGVTPDVLFPSAFDAEEFGERSYPSALPWDQIGPTAFEPVEDVNQDIINMLNEKFLTDLESDEDLKKLVADIEKTKQNREKNEISLNESERRKEIDQDEEDLPTASTIEETEISTETGVAEENVNDLNDAYLKESLILLAKLVDYKIG